MSEGRLQGWPVVVTRRREDAPALVQALGARGAVVTCVPMIRFAPPDDPAPLAAARAGLDRYQLLVLTSKQAVHAFLDGLAVPARSPRVVAVGHGTAAAIRALHWPVHLEGTGEGGEALAAEMTARGELAGQRVLYPLSSLARSRLPATLRAAGAVVDEVVAYQTLPPRPEDGAALWPLLADPRAIVVFASPSAAQHLDLVARAHGVPVAWAAQRCVAIGPTTRRALAELGARRVHEAAQPDDAGLLDAIDRAVTAAQEDRP